MKIAIIGEMHSDGWITLEKSNFEVFEITNFSKANLIKELIDVDGVILRTAANLTSEVLKDCKNIKIIARHGVGYDNVDLKFLTQNNNSFKTIDFKVSDENAWNVGLACGGEMKVLIEQVNK